MRIMHEFFATSPFDLYELSLFQSVAKHRSFTKAAEATGLTQSAMTRQIQGMEKGLGIDLFERTTRQVRLTEAGEFLAREAARILGDVEHSWQRMREEFAGARRIVRVGVSRSIGLAYLPGFFHANLRKSPQIGCHVSSQSSTAILAALESDELDLGVVSPPKRWPRTLRVTHRFDDAFTLIAPRPLAAAFHALPKTRKARAAWMKQQAWLLIEDSSNTGAMLRDWMKGQGLAVEPAMQLDGFDLIINLVSLGMGLSAVPIRALALYGRKRSLQRLPWEKRFVRELVVAVRKHRRIPVHVAEFIENVLF